MKKIFKYEELSKVASAKARANYLMENREYLEEMVQDALYSDTIPTELETMEISGYDDISWHDLSSATEKDEFFIIIGRIDINEVLLKKIGMDDDDIYTIIDRLGIYSAPLERMNKYSKVDVDLLFEENEFDILRETVHNALEKMIIKLNEYIACVSHGILYHLILPNWESIDGEEYLTEMIAFSQDTEDLRFTVNGEIYKSENIEINFNENDDEEGDFYRNMESFLIKEFQKSIFANDDYAWKIVTNTLNFFLVNDNIFRYIIEKEVVRNGIVSIDLINKNKDSLTYILMMGLLEINKDDTLVRFFDYKKETVEIIKMIRNFYNM